MVGEEEGLVDAVEAAGLVGPVGAAADPPLPPLQPVVATAVVSSVAVARSRLMLLTLEAGRLGARQPKDNGAFAF